MKIKAALEDRRLSGAAWKIAVSIVSFGIGLGFAGGCGYSKRNEDATQGKPVPSVQVTEVTRATLEQILPTTGTLTAIPSREATLSAQVGATLDVLPVRFGARVERGQVVAQLSTSQLTGQIEQDEATLGQNRVQVQQAEANALQQQAQTRAAILQARATLRNAQAALSGAQATLTGDIAALQNAQQTLARDQTLYQEGLVAQKDVEAAQLAVQTAQAQVDAQRQTVAGQAQTVDGQRQAVAAAKAGGLQDLVKRKDIQVARQQVLNAQGVLTTARLQASLYTLRAPLGGTITALGATPGEAVDPSTKLMTISDLTVLQLQLGVPSGDVGGVHAGEAAVFTTDALPGQTFRTTVAGVSPQVDAAAGTIPVFAMVANPVPGRLKDDMAVSAKIVTARRVNVLTVPQSAVLTDADSGDKTVGVVGSDNVLHFKPVKVGLVADGRAEIVSGLRSGERIVASGDYGLDDGTAVQAQQDGSGGDGS